MHDKSNNFVIMVEIGLSKLDIAIVNNWIKITILIKNQICLEINIKVLEDKLDLALAWEDPRVNLLCGIDLPIFNCWEVNFDEGQIVATGKIKLNILDIKVNLFVGNIRPINFPGEDIQKHAEFIMVLGWELQVCVDISWQELFH